jgi:hypothetical protein
MIYKTDHEKSPLIGAFFFVYTSNLPRDSRYLQNILSSTSNLYRDIWSNSDFFIVMYGCSVSHYSHPSH